MEVPTHLTYVARQSKKFFVLVVAVGAVALLLFLALRQAGNFGRHIPTHSIDADYLLGVIWGVVLGVAIVWWPANPKERSVLLILWGARLVTTLLLMLVYENQYDFLDSYSYFAESRALSQGFYVEDVAFGTTNITYLFAFLWKLLPPSFHALKVTCAYVGLAAVFLFYKAWQSVTESASIPALWVLGLTPSILFWSSVLGKDPIVLLGIALAAWGVARQWRRGADVAAIATIVCGIVLMSAIRPWMGLITIAAIGAASVFRPSTPIVRYAWLGFGAAALVGLVILVRRMPEVFTQMALLEALEAVSSSWATGGSAAKQPIVFSSIGDVVAFLPRGIFTALFRPLPGEIGGAFGLAAGVENLLLLLAVGWAVVRILRMKWEFPLLFTLSLLAFWSLLYAFLSYQNLGTAVRFKLQVMPFMVAIIGFAAAYGDVERAAQRSAAART